MIKILSIDGGGIRGIIPALVLADIEHTTGKAISECFDLIAGTSTGGILALGLSRNNGQGKPRYTARELADMYATRGKEIFSHSLLRQFTSIDGIIGELYSHQGLDNVLDDCFGNETLDSALTKTLITSYDIQNREPIFLKSWRDEYGSMLMKYAARATSAAPTYFEPALVPLGGNTRVLIDGGVFMNTPAVSAYVEAKKIFPDEKDFFVLSIGTGELIRPIAYDEAKGWGSAGWLLPLMSCMFDGMADASNYQMKLLLGDGFIRLQTTLAMASDDMDNASEENIGHLMAEAEHLIQASRNELNRVCRLPG